MDGRLRQLDGLRGLAALVVVIFHFLSAFAPNFIPDQIDTPYVLADTPFGIFFNGPFSVSIFFVLSGFVVSNAAAKRRSPIYLNLALRYVRLAVPVLFSVIFAWMLLELMPTATLSLDAASRCSSCFFSRLYWSLRCFSRFCSMHRRCVLLRTSEKNIGCEAERSWAYVIAYPIEPAQGLVSTPRHPVSLNNVGFARATGRSDQIRPRFQLVKTRS